MHRASLFLILTFSLWSLEAAGAQRKLTLKTSGDQRPRGGSTTSSMIFAAGASNFAFAGGLTPGCSEAGAQGLLSIVTLNTRIEFPGIPLVPSAP